MYRKLRAICQQKACWECKEPRQLRQKRLEPGEGKSGCCLSGTRVRDLVTGLPRHTTSYLLRAARSMTHLDSTSHTL